MIGTGAPSCDPTSTAPGQDKANFYVFDFCGDLEFFSQDLPGSEGSAQKSMAQRPFEMRLALVSGLDTAGVEGAASDGTESASGLRRDTAEWLLLRADRTLVAGVTWDEVGDVRQA